MFLALSQLILALLNRGLHRKRVFLALAWLVLALFNRGLHRKRVFLALFIGVYRVIFSWYWVKSGFQPPFS